MAAKLTRLTHKVAIQLHLVAESCIICSSRSRRPVRKLLDTPSYIYDTSRSVTAPKYVHIYFEQAVPYVVKSTFSETVTKYKYLGTRVTDQNYIHHSVQNILSSRIIFGNLAIEVYKTGLLH
jgi:hypothetical protein